MGLFTLFRRATRPARPPAARPGVEVLEGRTMPAVGATLGFGRVFGWNAVLRVEGTADKDVITITPQNAAQPLGPVVVRVTDWPIGNVLYQQTFACNRAPCSSWRPSGAATRW